MTCEPSVSLQIANRSAVLAAWGHPEHRPQRLLPQSRQDPPKSAQITRARDAPDVRKPWETRLIWPRSPGVRMYTHGRNEGRLHYGEMPLLKIESVHRAARLLTKQPHKTDQSCSYGRIERVPSCQNFLQLLICCLSCASGAVTLRLHARNHRFSGVRFPRLHFSGLSKKRPLQPGSCIVNTPVSTTSRGPYLFVIY